MPITVGSNIAALRTVRTLELSSAALSSTFEKLSSGQRINRASDDSAGLSVASSLGIKARIFSQGIRNINDGVSMMSIAEGALGNLYDIVTRVGELANQAASGTLSGRQRVALDREADSLLKEYNRIIESTSFNGMKILDGSEDTVSLQHGIGDEQTTVLGLGRELGDAAGDGTFGLGVSFAPGVSVVATGDVTGDAVTDLVYSTGAVTNVLAGNGNGTFRSAISSSNGTAFSATSMQLADLNNDGRNDVIAVDSATSSGTVLLGRGDGTFQARLSFATDTNPWMVSVNDVNNDGRADLVVGTNNGASILLGNGDGTFQAARNESATGGRTTSTADFNNDGNVDIITGGALLLGNGDGSFARGLSFDAGYEPWSADVADLNNDGNMDMITTNYGHNVVRQFLGNGNGTFAVSTTFSTNTWPSTLSLADINGDQSLDIIVTNAPNNTYSVLVGNGNGSYRAPISYATLTSQSNGRIADFNSDGVIDLMTSSASAVQLYLGNADSSGRRNNEVAMVDLSNILGARNAITWSNKQLTKISRELGAIGAYQSRLQTTLSVLDTTRINSQAGASRITDTDVASEAAESVRLRILQQTGQKVLTQANVQPQIALILLRER